MADPSTGQGAETALIDEIREIIVESLMLEDVDAQGIDPDAALFGEPGDPGGDSLGLDSIDALELAMALHKRYGVRTRSDDERNREIFRCVRSLAQFVTSERVK